MKNRISLALLAVGCAAAGIYASVGSPARPERGRAPTRIEPRRPSTHARDDRRSYRGAPRSDEAAEPAAPSDWSATVQERIAASEYAFRPEGREFAATNRAQELRARFDGRGAVISRRDGAGPSLRIGGAYLARGARRTALRNGRPSLGGCRADGAVDVQGECLRMLVSDRGGAKEVWENRRDGIEQTIVVEHRLAGDGALEVLVEVEGGTAAVSADGLEARISQQGATLSLRYAGLKVLDAGDRELEARMEARGGAIAIVVNDEGARYPVRIDPLVTTASWTAESAQATAYFGCSVSSAGDTNGDGFGDVVVGARSYDAGQADEGRAYLFLGGPTGLAASPAWTAESDQMGASFGGSVAHAGDVNGDGYGDVVIGSWAYANGQANEGRAYLYLGGASGLGTSPAWTAESNQANAYFGLAVASAGDVNADGYADVVVGSPYYSNVQLANGRAYVYLGGPSGLGTSPVWTAQVAQSNASFGTSVSSAGDVNGDGYGDVVVGCPNWNGGQLNEGGAFVYLGNAGGLGASAAWSAESDQTGAQLGDAVAGAGDVNGDGYGDVLVGDSLYDGGLTDEGRVTLYLGGAGGLGASPSWTEESDAASARFGASAASAGDVNGDGFGDVVIGAYQYTNGEGTEGRAYVYLGGSSGLAANPTWTVESNQTNASLGMSVASAGDVNGDGFGDVVVGAHRYSGARVEEGRALLYLGGASGLSASPSSGAESDQTGALLGSSVSDAGDVDGDGYDDVVVGAPSFDNGEPDEGRALLFLGGPSGLAATATWTAEPDRTGETFGSCVSSAGDVNGDGYDDVLVGAPAYDNVQSDEGGAYLYLGGPGGLGASPAWTAESDQAAASFGSSLSSAGDVNGDGYGDVVVGAWRYDDGQTDEGRAYVYLGGAGGLGATPAWTATSDQAIAGFGMSVSSAGDVDGDGYGDVVVGAYRYANGEANEGRAFLYRGGANGLAATPAWTAESDLANAVFGASVSSAGDVNGDGYGDVVVGSPYFANGQTDEGRVFLYLGGVGGLAVSDAWTAESDLANSRFGASVSSAGDVNGDGFGDVLVGAPFYGNGQLLEGRAYLYLGQASGLGASAPWTTESNQANAFLGWSVSNAGDVNGDGYGDVVVGSLYFDGGQADEGRMDAYLGNQAGLGTNARRRLRTTRPTDSTPIAAWTRAPANAFDVSIGSRTLYGRTRARVEIEAKPRGTAFDGTGLIVGAFTDSTVAGTDLVQQVSATLGRDYHVRARVHFDPSRGHALLWTPWVYGGLSGDAQGVHLRTGYAATGGSCGGGPGCANGFCVNGVCCDSACGGGATNDCIACSVASGATTDGACATIAAAVQFACRPAAGVCDAAEICDGSSPACPAVDAKLSGTVCRSAAPGMLCDAPEVCDGVSDACPSTDALVQNGVACRPATAPCDYVETCNGATPACPTDRIKTANEGGPCRMAADVCDLPDYCDGLSSACPADDFKPNLTLCGLSTGLCDQDDYCNGTSPSCPNRLQPDGFPCNDGLACSQTESCQQGACAPTLTLDCSDGNACTTDTCAEPGGCTHTPIASCVLDAGTDSGSVPTDAGGTPPTPTPAASGCSCRVGPSAGDASDLSALAAIGVLAIALARARLRGVRRAGAGA